MVLKHCNRLLHEKLRTEINLSNWLLFWQNEKSFIHIRQSAIHGVLSSSPTINGNDGIKDRPPGSPHSFWTPSPGPHAPLSCWNSAQREFMVALSTGFQPWTNQMTSDWINWLRLPRVNSLRTVKMATLLFLCEKDTVTRDTPTHTPSIFIKIKVLPFSLSANYTWSYPSNHLWHEEIQGHIRYRRTAA